MTDAARRPRLHRPRLLSRRPDQARRLTGRVRRSAHRIADPLGIAPERAAYVDPRRRERAHGRPRSATSRSTRASIPRARDDRGRRRRRRDDDRHASPRSSAATGCWCRGPQARCRRAAACSRTSSPSSASAVARTRTASTTTSVNGGLATLDAPDRRVLRPAARPRRSCAGRSSSSRPVTRTRSGSSRCRLPAEPLRGRGRRRGDGRRVPHGPRARLRGQRARPAHRVHLLEGPRDGDARRSPSSRGSRGERVRPHRRQRASAWFGRTERDRRRRSISATSVAPGTADSTARRSIEEPTTTVVVYPSWTATVDRHRRLPA